MLTPERPLNVPEALWNNVFPNGSWRDLVETEPHPPQLRAIPCSGNDLLNYRKNHVWQVRLHHWSWSSETIYGWGQWKIENVKILSNWIPQDQIGIYDIGDGIMEKPEMSSSYGICDLCDVE